MTNTIVQKVKRIIEGIEIGYFDTAKSFYDDSFDEYFQYFGDSDKETRKHAILFFTTMLGNWHSKASFIFIPKKERLKQPDYQPNEVYFDFEDYIKSFLEHHEMIEKEFPCMHEYIISLLIRIEKEKGKRYEKWFPEIPEQLFKQLREEILIPKKDLLEVQSPFSIFFKEIGIKPFFKSDFID